MNELILFLSTPGVGEVVLVVIFAFVVVLILGSLIHSKWNWLLKSIITGSAGAFFILAFFAILNMQGWPTAKDMPDDFQIISFYVEPPNRHKNSEGFITLWILNFDKNNIGVGKPRSYQLEYDVELHKDLQKQKLESKGRGERMGGRNKKRSNQDDSDRSKTIEPYRLPNPNVPPKDPE